MKSQAIIAAFGLPVVALALALSTGCAGGSTADSSSGDGGDGPSGTSGQSGSGQAVSGSGSGAVSGSGAGGGSGAGSGTGGGPMNNPNCNGGCATGQNWKWDGMPAPPQYVPGAVTDGPMPPTQGGGSGLDPSGTPVTCYGGNFGDYSDNASFCDYIANRFRYLENECGNFNTAFLTVDSSLAAIAQKEAEDVAGGKCPNGPQSCGNWAEMLYIDGWQGNYLSRSAIYTAPESNMMVAPPDSFTPGYTAAYPKHACQFVGEFANVMLYHYCVWEGTMVTDPSTQPKRVGCGTAVDKSGVTWRVVQLGK